MDAYFFEDFKIGERFKGKGITFTEANIIDFALQYDPQPIHIDAHASESGVFGGLIASGLQTIALTFRSFWDTGVMSECGMGAPGMDKVIWHTPLRPGDTLYGTGEVLEIIPSKSRNDRGIVRMRYTGENQKGELIVTLEIPQIMRKRQVAG